VKDCPKVLASKESRRFVYYLWEVVKAHRRGGYVGKGHQQQEIDAARRLLNRWKEREKATPCAAKQARAGAGSMAFTPYCLESSGRQVMATKFSDVMRELEAEAQAEGPGAVKELETFRAHFRLGRQIAEARRARRLTQKQVAEIARIDQADVSNIERGAANPTFTTLNAVVSAVGMEIGLARKRRPSIERVPRGFAKAGT
jgi:DNA-binding XRE family transcriptional regulator